MTIAEDFKKWMGEKASQVADYAGDYPGRVEEQFRSGLSSMQQERQAGLPGHLGASQARYALSTPFVMDALSQAGKGLSKLGQQQQLGIDEVMSRIGVDVPERKETEPMGAGIPAVLWGILRGKKVPSKARAKVKEEELPPDVFHVTFSSKVPSIREKGLRQFETSNWVRAGTPGVRYNEDAGLFAWENPKDALYWAKKMELEFPGQEISILRIKGGEHWGDDPAGREAFQRALEGKPLRSGANISAEDVVKEFTISKVPGAGTMGISFDEWIERISKMLDWKG